VKRGTPHWLPDGKYGWNGNLFTASTIIRFRITNGAGFVDLLVSKANISGGGLHVLVRNMRTVLPLGGYLALLRLVVFVGQSA
jgi:hypothetical protein